MEQPNPRLWQFPLALTAALMLAACGKTEESAQQMPTPKVSVAEVIEQPLNAVSYTHLTLPTIYSV